MRAQDAAELLPISLQELQRNFREPAQCGYQAEYGHLGHGRDSGSMLASFKRLSNLQKLNINFGDYYISHDGYHCTASHRMDKLRRFEMHDAAFCVKRECSLPELLPNIETMVVYVDLMEGYKPEELVTALLHHVPKVTLYLRGNCISAGKNKYVGRKLTVTVAKSSALQCLCVRAIMPQELILKLNKQVEVIKVGAVTVHDLCNT